jgi:hypothetical protein
MSLADLFTNLDATLTYHFDIAYSSNTSYEKIDSDHGGAICRVSFLPFVEEKTIFCFRAEEERFVESENRCNGWFCVSKRSKSMKTFWKKADYGPGLWFVSSLLRGFGLMGNGEVSSNCNHESQWNGTEDR